MVNPSNDNEQNVDFDNSTDSKENSQSENIEVDTSLFSDDATTQSTIKTKILEFASIHRKKIWIWIFLLVLSISFFVYFLFFWPIKWSWAIISKTTNLPVFDEVILDANVNLHFVQEKWWVKIVWDDNIVEKINFEVDWSSLRISKKWLKKIKPSKDIEVYVYSLNINSIIVNWKWKLLSDWQTIQTSDLKITTYGSSLVNLKLDVDKLHTVVYWSSSSYYHWKANVHNIDIHGSAVINSSRFITKESKVLINWSWVCDIFAWMKLWIEINWVWQIIYDWNPPEYKEKNSWLWIVEKSTN